MGERFTGKRLFVTGAASGIGSATLELLRREGGAVVGADITPTSGLIECDVTDRQSVQRALDEAATRLNGIDACINVAGINVFAKLEDLSVELFQRHLDVNVIGPMLVIQAALPHLRHSRGNVVTVASISGLQGQPYNSAYCASKGAVLLLMRSLAVELASDGIRVNCVCPGGVDTPMPTSAAATLPADADLGLLARMTGVIPGFMPPDDVAQAIAYLASDDAASVTGTALVVDRGTLW